VHNLEFNKKTSEYNILILGIYKKLVSKTPDFNYILDHYIENMPARWKVKISTKTMEFLASTPDDTIYTYDQTQEVAYEGGTFSYLRINLSYGDEVSSKFGSFQRLKDLVPHIKSGEKLRLVYDNIVEAYESQGGKVHG
jgi:hypothetical protein